jgi:hypothetical protein
MECSDKTYEFAQAVNELERISSYSCHLYPKEISIGTHWMGDGMDAIKQKETLAGDRIPAILPK